MINWDGASDFPYFGMTKNEIKIMFSKASQYALRAVLYIARESSPTQFVKVEEIARNLGIPKSFLSKILQNVKRAGFISSMKGPNGGFYLSEKNLENNIYEVLLVMEGQEASINQCILGLDNCSSEKPCPYHEIIYKSKLDLVQRMKNETIGESVLRMKKDNLKLVN